VIAVRCVQEEGAIRPKEMSLRRVVTSPAERKRMAKYYSVKIESPKGPEWTRAATSITSLRNGAQWHGSFECNIFSSTKGFDNCTRPPPTTAEYDVRILYGTRKIKTDASAKKRGDSITIRTVTLGFVPKKNFTFYEEMAIQTQPV
jgi:hypothetical protein